MAIVKTDEQNYVNIANAIREKTGSAETFTPGEMGNAILAIPTGGGSGLTNEVKQALLQIAEKVAYVDANGQTYYNALFNALFTVVSIEAVFTQGQAVIYDDDSLDTLKDYLVVTATYDDESTAVVTDYTLSGTLTAGTSTITVTYGDKTDTFSVVVHAGLPSAYTKYDYMVIPTLQNSKPKASWIELAKYQDLNALSCEFEVKPNLTLSQASCLGRRSASGYSSSFGFYAKGESLGWHLHGTEANVEPSTIVGAVNVVKYTNTNASPSSLQTNDNAPVSVVWTNNNVLNLAPVMFSNPINDSDSNMCRDTELGYIKFFDLSGILISHYIPVVRSSDNRIGMFDLIEQVFYTTATASYSTIDDANCYYAVGNWS